VRSSYTPASETGTDKRSSSTCSPRWSAPPGLAISGTTDDVGVARMKVPRAGRYTISVSTPVLKDGTREELKETVVVKANETSTIEIKAAVAPDGT